MHFERNPALALADLFADTSCDSDTPLKEGHISINSTDGPGMRASMSPNKPMTIVFRPPIQDGKYLIRNRAKGIYWNCAGFNGLILVWWNEDCEGRQTAADEQSLIILQLFNFVKLRQEFRIWATTRRRRPYSQLEKEPSGCTEKICAHTSTFRTEEIIWYWPKFTSITQMLPERKKKLCSQKN